MHNSLHPFDERLMGKTMPGVFTEEAKDILNRAQEEAKHFQHYYIGTEHLLLGILSSRESSAAKVLINLGVSLEKVRHAVEFIIGHGGCGAPDEIKLTPRAKRAVDLAIDEAYRMGHPEIGTEHLLLGLVLEGEGIAAGVLESLGVSLEQVHRQVIRVLSNVPPLEVPGSRYINPLDSEEDDVLADMLALLCLAFASLLEGIRSLILVSLMLVAVLVRFILFLLEL